MFLPNSKKIVLLLFTVFIAVSSLFIISCQKEISGEGFIPNETPPDLSTKISSSVSGFVTDESEKAVNGAIVTIGSSTATTDKYGFFEITNAQVVKEAAVVTVAQPGYFKGIKTYIATEGKSAFFRIKLIPKTNEGSIDATAGGNVTLSNGLIISLPTNAVVNAATSSAYSGQVNVAVQWLNPLADDLDRTMPGDLRGLDSNGALKSLTTYGMAAVELTGSGGELLQIASGKKATLTIPLPSGISSSAPSTIPLWYFDEALGLWKQQGNAVKTGNNYVGDVSHFSFWNCDIAAPNGFVNFNATIVNSAGMPIANASIFVKHSTDAGWGAHGYTDSSGYVKGGIPANSQLVFEVYTDGCNTPVYSQTINTTTSSISLGTITIGTSSSATITGNVTNCSSMSVTDGYVLVKNGTYYYRSPVNPDGTFSFNTILCSGASANVQILAVDNATSQQGNVLAYNIVSGNNPIGTLNACGTSIEQFINYTINGTSYSIATPADSLTEYINTQATPPLITVSGYSPGNTGSTSMSAYIVFSQTGIAVGSTQNLVSFITKQFSDSSSSATITTPIPVNITEYGTVGQFVAGNFTGTLTGPAPANTLYNVTCNFRVRRR